MENNIIERYKKLDTPLISDAMDELKIPGCLLGIDAVLDDKIICGEAFTVHYVPNGLDEPGVGSYFDEVKEGQVVVIDNSGRIDGAVWGDITTRIAKNRKYEGTVIDGAYRDLKAIQDNEYPVFAKAKCMVSGKHLVQVSQTNVPVAIAGMRVCPGDLIFGDNTGVISIPAVKVIEVLDKAEEIQKKENAVFEKLSKQRGL